MFIFHPQEEKIATARKIVTESLQKENITIEEEKDFGLRTLAYPIQKEEQGHYWLYNLQMDPSQVSQTSLMFRHVPEILRSLVVRK